MFYCQEKISKNFERGLLHLILFFLISLEGDRYRVPSGTVVTGILDMRPGKHDLHFLVGAELLPHTFVNIPDEKMNIRVFIFNYIFYLFFFNIYFKFYSYVFFCSFLPYVIQL
jgi:hypothetical protein